MFSSQGVEEGISEALIIITTYYYTLLHQLMLHCYFIYVNELYKLLAVLISCWKNRLKMLVFDRPSSSPLSWYFYNAVHYTASSSILIQLHNCLECLGLSLAEYARYSPLLLFPPFVLYTQMPAIQTLEPRSRSTLTAPTTTSSSPLTRSSSEVPRQEASPFRSL